MNNPVDIDRLLDAIEQHKKSYFTCIHCGYTGTDVVVKNGLHLCADSKACEARWNEANNFCDGGTVYPYDCQVPCCKCVHRLECIEMREQPVKDKPILYRYVCRKCGKPFRRDEHLEPDQRICVWCMSEVVNG